MPSGRCGLRVGLSCVLLLLLCLDGQLNIVEEHLVLLLVERLQWVVGIDPELFWQVLCLGLGLDFGCGFPVVVAGKLILRSSFTRVVFIDVEISRILLILARVNSL